jgi:hypothetical protein
MPLKEDPTFDILHNIVFMNNKPLFFLKDSSLHWQDYANNKQYKPEDGGIHMDLRDAHYFLISAHHAHI